MANIAVLAAELAGSHPVTGAYSADASVAADQLNAANITTNRETISGKELLEQTDATEYNGLADGARALWVSLCSMDTVDPFHAGVVQIITSIFGSGPTLTALQAARTETISRAQQLGLGSVRAGTVNEARA
jgi:hypothetical protein